MADNAVGQEGIATRKKPGSGTRDISTLSSLGGMTLNECTESTLTRMTSRRSRSRGDVAIGPLFRVGGTKALEKEVRSAVAAQPWRRKRKNQELLIREFWDGLDIITFRLQGGLPRARKGSPWRLILSI